VDASDIGMGAVLLQAEMNGQDHPVCYFSKKFNCHQRNYCTSEKETLALILSCQNFEVYLSSKYWFLQITTHWFTFSVCKTRIRSCFAGSLLLQEFQLDIFHVRGKNNVVADALSRAV